MRVFHARVLDAREHTGFDELGGQLFATLRQPFRFFVKEVALDLSPGGGKLDARFAVGCAGAVLGVGCLPSGPAQRPSRTRINLNPAMGGTEVAQRRKDAKGCALVRTHPV